MMPNSTFLIAIDLHHLVRSVCYTLLHSLWLGAVAAVLAGVVIACTIRSKPSLRYNLLLGIVGLFVSASAVCFFNSFSQRASLIKVSTAITSIEKQPLSFPVSSSPVVATTSQWQQFLHFIDANANIIVLCWLAVFLWRAVRLVVGLNGLQQCRLQRTLTPGEEWTARAQALARQLNIHKAVKVLESALVKVPCTIGYFKPVILVPLGMFTSLPPAQVESILLHELAHVKRHDFAINIVLECIESVFFFNPAIYWLLSVIRQEREVCCDALVTACHGQPKPYMEALVSFQEQFSQAAYMMPLTGGHASLLDRVKRMINKKNKNLTIMEKVFLSLSIVAVISLSFIPASDARTAKQKQAQQANVNTSATSRVATSYSSSETLLFKSITQTNVETAVAELDKQNEVNQQLQDSIINVHSYTVANPSKRTDYMEITVMSGNRYKIAKENGVIVSFSINGVERDVREVANYSAMIKTVETRAAVAEKEREKAEKEREKIEKRRDEVDARRASIEQERQVVEQKRQQAEQKRLEAEGRTEAPESHRATIEQRRGEIEQRRAEAEQHRIEAEQRHIEAEAKHKIAMAKREQAFRIHDSLKAVQAQKVKDIINLLVKTGVVKSPESVQWFSLTDAALVVNGQQQDAALHQQLVKAYGIQPDLGLYYGNVPGPAKGYFFGRHEIDLAR